MEASDSRTREQPRKARARLARRWLADRRGTVAIEVGLLAAPFFMLVLGILIIGFMTWCNSTLDFATQKAARKIMTGALQASNTNLTQFKTNILCSYLPSAAFDCTKLVVNLQVVPETAEPTGWYNYVNASQTALKMPAMNGATSFCMGTGNAYQVLEVLYPLPVFSSFLTQPGGPTPGAFVIMSTAAFKNEPFQGASNQGSC